MPDLGEIASEYDKETFQLIGIISDVMEQSDTSDIANAKELIRATRANTYPHLLLNKTLYSNIVGASDSVPTTYFVNQKGEVLGYIIGSNSKKYWVEVIDMLLEQEGA